MRYLPFGLLLVAAACGGSSSTNPQPTPSPMTGTISATPSLAFTPSTVTVAPGGTVTFAFGSVAHNVFFDPAAAGAPADIPGSNQNVSVGRTFSTAGTYVYNCHIHPGMQGTVVVSTSVTADPGGGYTGY